MAELNSADGLACGPAAAAGMLLRGAEQWTRVQCEMLSSMELAWAQWAERQRAALDASTVALRQMADCRSLADMARVQQQWFADAARRGAANVGALATDTVALGQLAAGIERSAETRGWAAPTRPPVSTGQSEQMPEHRQAAE